MQDFGDPFVRKLLISHKIKKIMVKLIAPRKGNFFGAFLMILAKANDVMGFLKEWHIEVAKEHQPELVNVDSSFTLLFDVEFQQRKRSQF